MSGGTLVQTYAAHGLGMSSGTEDTQAGSPGLAGAVARRLNFVVPTSASPVITQSLNSHRTPQVSYGHAYSGGFMLRPKGTAASQRSRATPVSTLSPQLDSQVKRSPALSAAGSSIVRYGVIFEDAEVHAGPNETQSCLVPSVSYGLRADVDSSEDEADEATSSYRGRTQAQQHTQQHMQRGHSRRPGAVAVSPPSALLELVEHMQERLTLVATAASVEKRRQRAVLLSAEDHALATQLASISKHAQQKQDALLAREAESAAALAADRRRRLQALQQSHAQAAALTAQQVTKLAEAEAARRAAEEARARAEAQARVKAEQERAAAVAQAAADRAAAAAQAAAEAEQKAKLEAAQRAAEVDAKQKADKEAKDVAAAAAQRASRVCATDSALQDARAAAAALASMQESYKHLLEGDACKKTRRDIEKQLTKDVQQISGTQSQVHIKISDVIKCLAKQPDEPWRNYAIVTFATKVLRQSGLVLDNPKAAFPLATVLVHVSLHVPNLMLAWRALLYKECVLAVPQAVPHDLDQLTPTQYHSAMGYSILEDESAPNRKAFESVDTYLGRVEGLMMLYGAVVQVGEASNPHGFDAAWRYLTRFVNTMPADRATAKALSAFLRMAGYGMHARFRGQFVKVLQLLATEFMPTLRRSQDADVASVAVVLDAYITDAKYRQEPAGRAMPRVDASSLSDNRA